MITLNGSLGLESAIRTKRPWQPNKPTSPATPSAPLPGREALLGLVEITADDGVPRRVIDG
jgi:hypothetical protein